MENDRLEIRLDMHVHSCFSPDSRSTVEEIIRTALKKGLRGAAICDHDRAVSSYELKAAAEKAGTDKKLGIRINPASPCENAFYLIGGCEYAFSGSHILGIFLEDTSLFPSPGISPGVFSDKVAQSGGYTVAAHPYERIPDGGEAKEEAMKCGYIEVFNSRADSKYLSANERAHKLSEASGKPGTAGSDSHSLPELGNAYISCFTDNALYPSYDGLKKMFTDGKFSPAGKMRSPRRYIPKSAFIRALGKKNIRGMIKSSILFVIYSLTDLFGKK